MPYSDSDVARNIPSARTREKSCRIGELARRAGVTIRAIRYYEELGILAAPERDSRHRRYTNSDLVHLQRVQQLKGYGLALGEIREIFELAREDPTGEKSRRRLLERYREKWREAADRRLRLEQYMRELEWHVQQLEGVGDFRSCPGEECRQCRFAGMCKFYKESQ
jgi:DNA-binding transcriptional MerR regulator